MNVQFKQEETFRGKFSIWSGAASRGWVMDNINVVSGGDIVRYEIVIGLEAVIEVLWMLKDVC